MIVYLTYNEAPSGIFTSQVIDVVKFLNQNLNAKVRLLAFISIRNYFFNRKDIKDQLADALVIPMFPKIENWKYNSFLLHVLCYIIRPEKIIARSVIATELALWARGKKLCEKVIYDGRGAIAAEWKEYNVVKSGQLLSKIAVYENEVIHKSDYRIAVSGALVKLWNRNYNYFGNKQVIIPCTLNSAFANLVLSQNAIADKRKEIGLSDEDTVFVYSGSVAGWQSFGLIQSFIEPILISSGKNKMLFFSPAHPGISAMQEKFPEQIFIKQLKPSEVQNYLITGDYGLLIREQSETNEVASPVKYAEYLSCGLKVIISEALGDYTKLTLEKLWGSTHKQFILNAKKPSFAEKIKISKDTINMFSKENFIREYRELVE